MENPNEIAEMEALKIIGFECIKSILDSNKSDEAIYNAVAKLSIKCHQLGKETMMNAIKPLFDEMKETYRVAM